MTLKRITIPNTDLNVSSICLGCWQFNDGVKDINWEGQSFETSKAIVDEALNIGVNFFDTAEAYRNSESVLGRCIKGHSRGDIVIASKFGYSPLPDGKKEGFSAEDMEKSLMRSLHNLQTDYIDLYQAHWPPVVFGDNGANLEPANVFVKELNRHVALGHIKYWGVCNFGVKSIDVIRKSGGKPVTNQVPYNLLTRCIEFSVQDACIDETGHQAVSLLAYSPLMQGILTGKFYTLEDIPIGRRRDRHFHKDSSRVSRHGTEGVEKQFFEALNGIRHVLNETGIEMSDAALSWILNQKYVSNVIVGASRPDQLKRNAQVVNLTQEMVDRLSDVTEDLKNAFGGNLDVYAPPSESRYY